MSYLAELLESIYASARFRSCNERIIRDLGRRRGRIPIYEIISLSLIKIAYFDILQK